MAQIANNRINALFSGYGIYLSLVDIQFNANVALQIILRSIKHKKRLHRNSASFKIQYPMKNRGKNKFLY